MNINWFYELKLCRIQSHPRIIYEKMVWTSDFVFNFIYGSKEHTKICF